MGITSHTTERARTNENTNYFWKRNFITKSHVTTRHYYFLYKIHGYCTTHSQEKKILFSIHWGLRPCAIHKDLTDNKWLACLECCPGVPSLYKPLVPKHTHLHSLNFRIGLCISEDCHC